nr:hypothetical protein [Tanacetum cinerariifolium]
MSLYSRCSWCGGSFNGGNCQHCTNVSFGDEFVHNPDPISNNETLDFSYPPSQPQTSSFDQFHCFGCGDPLEEGVRCQRCTCKWCENGLSKGFCFFCASRDENSSIDAPNPNSFDNPPDFSYQPQYETYTYYCNEKIDIRYRRECESMIDELKGKFNGMSIEINKKKELQQLKQESVIPLNEIVSQIPSSIEIIPVLPTFEEPEDSLIMGDEDLNAIPKKETDEVIKYSVEDLVLILSESKDTSGSDSEYDLSSCDDFSPIDVPKEKSMTYSNPLFEFDDEYIFTDVNPFLMRC